MGILRKLLANNQPEHLPADRSDRLSRLNKKVTQLLREARYEEALEPALQAQELAIQHADDVNWDFASSLYNLAQLYTKIGRYVEAESLYRQVIEVDIRIRGKNHLAVVEDINSLADLYELLGKYTEAESLRLQALKVCHQVLGKDHPQLADVMSRLASLYMTMARYVEAHSIMQQALDLLRRTIGEDQLAFTALQSNFAGYYLKAGMYAEAESLYLQALRLEHTILGETNPSLAVSVHNLACLYYRMGKYDEAEQLFSHSLVVLRDAPGKDLHLADALNNYAAFYLHIGRYSEAEPLLHQALDIKERILGGTHPDLGIIRSNLSHLYAATDRAAEALELIGQVVKIDNTMIAQIFCGSSERQRLVYLESKTLEWELYLSLVLLQLSQKTIKQAFDVFLRRKALTTEILVAQRDAMLTGKYPELAQQINRLTALRMQIAQKTLDGPDQESLGAHQKQLMDLSFRKEWLEAEIARQIPEMNLEKRLREVDHQAIDRALPEGSVLIDFACFNVCDFKAFEAHGEPQWQPARYVAFVLKAGEHDGVQLIDLGEAKPIDELITSIRGSIIPQMWSSNLRDAAGSEYGTALSKALITPLINNIQGCERLFISPDGELSILPFEILPLDGDRRIIDEYHVSYLGAGRDLIRLGQVPVKKTAAPLIIADPNFDLRLEIDDRGASKDFDSISLFSHPATMLESKSSLFDRSSTSKYSRDLDRVQMYFGHLEGTHEEGECIGRLLKVDPWFQDRALETRLKACRSPHIIHIATHGFFLENQQRDTAHGVQDLDLLGRMNISTLENPLLRSGLALAGINTWLRGGSLPPEAEDGLLTAEDVVGLDLADTGLVVLSACETGLGDVHVGEGVFGLRRAFVLAGARALVMSLWKIPDEQTRDMMIEFYRRILDGEPISNALRKAQLSMRERYPDPFYWGAFICQGDPYSISS